MLAPEGLTACCFFTAYDVTRRETFDSLDDIWMREVDMYSTIDESVKMVVANKCDKVTAATVISLLGLGMISTSVCA